MLVHTQTHLGLVRASNQDTLLVTSNAYGVADGMGGHKGGETASRVAAEVLVSALEGKVPDEKILKLGIEAANRRVYEMGRENRALYGMGTTLTVLWEGPQAILIGHVGDSRAYRYRDGELTPVTEDHSMVAELVKSKLITPEMASNHPYKNVITRALGIDPGVMPDILTAEKREGDTWLVCTDGLYNMVTDKQIAKVLKHRKGEDAAEKLLALAIEHGGHDNVSFVLCVVEAVSSE